MTNTFYLPPPSADARPEDVVRVVSYYAKQAGVEPTNADYARAGYWAAVGRQSDAAVMRGGCPVGQEATFHEYRSYNEGTLLIKDIGTPDEVRIYGPGTAHEKTVPVYKPGQPVLAVGDRVKVFPEGGWLPDYNGEQGTVTHVDEFWTATVEVDGERISRNRLMLSTAP
jgi:hypothetical protein